jgi:acyltransferase
MRLKNVDLLKGLLVFLVILGHMLPGSRNNSILLAIIYSFHMPLFIGVSGYLFNANKIKDYNLIELLKKYLFRIILPWIIAVIFYFPFLESSSMNTFEAFVKAFVFPSYHLWFVTGFLSWVIITWILKKFKFSNGILFLFGLLLTIVPVILKKIPEIYQSFGVSNSLVFSILDTFKPYYYFFFVLGLIFRDLELKRPKIIEYVIPLILLVLVVYFFYKPNVILSTFNLFLFNSFLLSLMLKISCNNLLVENKTLEWVGLNSLAIYLWHVFPILICKNVIGTENTILFYSSTVVLEIIFIFIYKYLLLIPFLKKYIFGM